MCAAEVWNERCCVAFGKCVILVEGVTMGRDLWPGEDTTGYH